MKVIIRERLAAGESEAEIRQYFVDRYGNRILAQPPTSGVSLAVWIVPPVGFALGGLGLFLVIREMRRRKRTARQGAVEAADAGLAPYLEQVDQDIAKIRDDRS